MKRIALGGMLAVCSLSVAADQPAVRYKTLTYGNGNYRAVIADMSSGKVVAEAVHTPRLTSARTLIGASKPTAAITGTFFNVHSAYPVADILIDGKKVSEGERGSILAVDWFGNVKIFDSKLSQKVDWFLYRYALRGLVRIMTDGQVTPNPRAQKFRDPRVWARTLRTAVGTTDKGKLVMIASTNGVTLSEIGKAMKKLGVTDAVGLDGGSSTCLFYRGKMAISPNRRLCNLFTIHELNDVAAEWASMPIRRRHSGIAPYLLTCPSRWYPAATTPPMPGSISSFSTPKPNASRQNR
jgi:hypothetical protein